MIRSRGKIKKQADQKPRKPPGGVIHHGVAFCPKPGHEKEPVNTRSILCRLCLQEHT